MTRVRTPVKCAFCGISFTPKGERGPKPKYCGRGHRQRAYELRKLARAKEAEKS